MSAFPIYLDYAATTPVAPDVAAAMADCLTREGTFGNPASRSHRYGWQAEQLVEKARQQVAKLINGDPREIVWTSGATESDNLALKGVFEAHCRNGESGHLITSAIEHKAILDVAAYLEELGVEVTYLKPNAGGLIQPEQVAQALRPDTRLVSLMAVNNELGTITDIAAIGVLLQDHKALFHVDGAQACGKIDVDVQQWQADMVSLCAHKMYGPKGVGALYVKRVPQVPLLAQIHGGGHERGMRSGTLATHQLVGFGACAEYIQHHAPRERERLAAIKAYMIERLAELDDVCINGDPNHATAHHLNVSVGGVDGAILLASLAKLAVASGSACNSASVEPSHVLTGIGLDREVAKAGLRFSFGHDTQHEDVKLACDEYIRCVKALREA